MRTKQLPLLRDILQKYDIPHGFWNWVWVTAGGQRFRVRDMTVSHIRNCIGWLAVQAPTRRVYDPLNDEFISDEQFINGNSVAEWSRAFKAELQRRGTPL